MTIIPISARKSLLEDFITRMGSEYFYGRKCYGTKGSH